jgi:WD40 repeat protein
VQGMRVNRLMLTNDEKILVSGHIGEVCLWKSLDLVKLSSIPDKLETGLPSSVGHHQAASCSCLAISHSTDLKPQFLFTACYNDERDCDIRRWHLQVLEKPRCVATSQDEVSFLPIFNLELSPNGAKLLTAHSGGRICMWSADSMKLEKSISVFSGSVSITSVVTDREWTTFAAFSNSESMHLGIICYDLIKCEEVQRFVCDALPQRMVYSSDGSYLFAGYNDGCVRKWNISTGQMHLVFRSGWNEEHSRSCTIC